MESALYFNFPALLNNSISIYERNIYVGDYKDKSIKFDNGNIYIDIYYLFHLSDFTEINSLLSLGNELLDKDELDLVQSDFYIFSEQVNRWSFFDFEIAKKTHKKLINYAIFWKRLLLKENVRKLIFNEDPHRGFDYIAYKFAKINKRDTFILSHINVEYRSYIKQSIEENFFELKTLKTQTKIKEIKPSNKHAFGKDVSRKEFTYKLLKKCVSIGERKREYITPYLKNKLFYNILVYAFLAKAYFYRKAYISNYNKLDKADNVEPNEIVYFSHYFPERTSNPLAYPFIDQIRCLEILSKTGRNVFYKEHPVSFELSNDHRNKCLHNSEFLTRIKNLNVKHLQNISGKFIVSTLNGTVGVEYALKGFKVICFGNPWYHFLPNVHVFQDLVTLNNFLSDGLDYDVELIEQTLRKYIEMKTFDCRTKELFGIVDHVQVRHLFNEYFLI